VVVELEFRPCGECTICCEGVLENNVYNYKMGNGVPCNFLIDKKCSIYNIRPNSCVNYQCAWSQHLLPEWMRPDKCGILVSVENDENKKQFLKVIELKEVVEYNLYDEINRFTKNNNTYWVKIPYKKIIPIKLI
jgi:Fe-S-cluster containining protein